jgi:hypothetical protein
VPFFIAPTSIKMGATMKKIIYIMVILLMASICEAQVSRAPNWVVQADCSGITALGKGCYNTGSKLLCIGNGSGTCVTLAAGGGSGDFMADGSIAMTGNLAMGAHNITMTGSLGGTGAAKLTKVWAIDAEFTNYPTVNGSVVFDQAVKAASNPSFNTINVVGANSLNLGTAGSLVGGIRFKNATSGYIEIIPITGALGSAQMVLGTTFTDGKLCQYTTATGMTCDATAVGDVTGPASPTAGYLVKWGPSGKALVDAGAFAAYTDAYVSTPVPLCATGTATTGACTNRTDAIVESCPTYASTGTTDQGTKNINIDGASYCDYLYSPLAGTAGVYTPVITAAPGSGKVRFITLTIGGGTNGVGTITWTNVDTIGGTMATSVTATKYSHYACKIPASGHAQCAVIGENKDY